MDLFSMKINQISEHHFVVELKIKEFFTTIFLAMEFFLLHKIYLYGKIEIRIDFKRFFHYVFLQFFFFFLILTALGICIASNKRWHSNWSFLNFTLHFDFFFFHKIHSFHTNNMVIIHKSKIMCRLVWNLCFL